jgi:hypothetical protein
MSAMRWYSEIVMPLSPPQIQRLRADSYFARQEGIGSGYGQSGND